MLYEWALTPDVFDATMLNADARLSLVVLEILRSLGRDGVLANLDNERWVKHIEGIRLAHPDYNPNLRARVLECLSHLKDRKRLVKYPSAGTERPETDRAWFDLTLKANSDYPLHGIVVNTPLYAACSGDVANTIDLPEVFESPQWRGRTTSRLVRGTKSDLSAVLRPLLRHARSLTIIDRYLSPHQERTFRFIELCAALLGDRGEYALPGRIHIHVGDPEVHGSPTERPTDRLALWEQRLRLLITPERRHRFKVFLWRDQPGADDTHERYILTDQCGVKVGRSFELDPFSEKTTEFSLLDEESWMYRVDQYTPGIGPLKLISEREIELDR